MFITSFIEQRKEQQKKQGCMADGAKLHPSSRIENLSGSRHSVRIGDKCQVLGQLGAYCQGSKISIGKSCFIGENTRIWSFSSISIGNNVMISHGVNIHDSNAHSLSASNRREHFNQIFSTGHPAHLEDIPAIPIVIEDDVWIGFNAIIMKGVTIGKGAVIGAASLVTKDVAPYCIVGGNPMRCLGSASP